MNEGANNGLGSVIPVPLNRNGHLCGGFWLIWIFGNGCGRLFLVGNGCGLFH